MRWYNIQRHIPCFISLGGFLKNKLLNFFQSIGNYIIKINDRRVIEPRTRTSSLLFLSSFTIILLFSLWAILWLPQVDVESVQWSLSAQAQSTAAIFGLLIAAMAFRWRRATDAEQQLQNKIYSYLRYTRETVTGQQHIIHTFKIAYDDYLAWINSNKPNITDSAYLNLGRLWALIQLSSMYRIRIKFGRRLTIGQTKELSKINKISENGAVDMWESYYRDSAEFALLLHETLDSVLTVLNDLEVISYQEREKPTDFVKGFYSKYALLGELTSSMLQDDSLSIADEVKKRRQVLSSFYFVSAILVFAIITGLLALTGVNSDNVFINANQNIIKWAVGVPVGLSAFGISLCLLYIGLIWR